MKEETLNNLEVKFQGASLVHFVNKYIELFHKESWSYLKKKKGFKKKFLVGLLE